MVETDNHYGLDDDAWTELVTKFGGDLDMIILHFAKMDRRNRLTNKAARDGELLMPLNTTLGQPSPQFQISKNEVKLLAIAGMNKEIQDRKAAKGRGFAIPSIRR